MKQLGKLRKAIYDRLPESFTIDEAIAEAAKHRCMPVWMRNWLKEDAEHFTEVSSGKYVKSKVKRTIKNSDVQAILNAAWLNVAEIARMMYPESKAPAKLLDSKLAGRNKFTEADYQKAFDALMVVTKQALKALGFLPVPQQRLDVQIKDELYTAIKHLGGKSCILSIVGSYKDTLSDEEVLDMLRRWNESYASWQGYAIETLRIFYHEKKAECSRLKVEEMSNGNEICVRTRNRIDQMEFEINQLEAAIDKLRAE